MGWVGGYPWDGKSVKCSSGWVELPAGLPWLALHLQLPHPTRLTLEGEMMSSGQPNRPGSGLASAGPGGRRRASARARHVPPGALAAAQTCLPGFFHTKHVSQGSNRSDEMGVPSPPSWRPHGQSRRARLPGPHTQTGDQDRVEWHLRWSPGHLGWWLRGGVLEPAISTPAAG